MDFLCLCLVVKADPSVELITEGKNDCADMNATQYPLSLEFQFNEDTPSSFNFSFKISGENISSTIYTRDSNNLSLSNSKSCTINTSINYPTNFPTEVHYFTIVISDPTISVTTYSGTDEYVSADQTITYEIYGTPSPSVVSPPAVCGLEAELVADTSWSDVSTYFWEVSDGELSNETESTAKIKADKPVTYNVILTETAGGLCSASVSDTIQLLGTPTAELSYDDNPENDPIVVCTSNAEVLPFGAIVSLTGYEPFAVEMSDGQSFDNLTDGDAGIEILASKADVITLARVTDVNGCEAYEQDMTGEVVVVDRRPSAQVTNDTVTYNTGKDIRLEALNADSEHGTYWTMTEEYAEYPTKFSPQEANPTYFTSTMSGQHAIYYIETDYDEAGVACSDTARLVLNIEVDARVPDGFSPNGDGRNDKLVIDGLVPNNLVMIFDSRGKKIYEKENYRNEWDAEGEDDGYYLLVAKGEGMKMVKETLVIKRSK